MVILFLSACSIVDNNAKVELKKLELKEKMYTLCISAGGIPRAYGDYEIVCDPKPGYSNTITTTR